MVKAATRGGRGALGVTVLANARKSLVLVSICLLSARMLSCEFKCVACECWSGLVARLVGLSIASCLPVFVLQG